MNELSYFREMMNRATENPFTSRYYGRPHFPAPQRAVYIGCAGLVLETWYRERANMHFHCNATCFSFIENTRRSAVARNVFYSACIRETTAGKRILPR